MTKLYSQPGKIYGNPEFNNFEFNIDSNINVNSLKLILNGIVYDTIDTKYNNHFYLYQIGLSHRFSTKIKDSVTRICIYNNKNIFYNIEVVDSFFNIRESRNNYEFNLNNNLNIVGYSVKIYLPLTCESEHNKNDYIIHFCRIEENNLLYLNRNKFYIDKKK